MSDHEIWSCGKRDHFGFQCQPCISSFIFPFSVDYGKIVQGLVFKRLEIIQRNHKLLPTYIRNIGLLNVLKYFASQISIWWGFIVQFQTIFFFYIIGATLLGLFFYQVSFYTVHKLLTLGGVEVFSQIISCIVPDPAGVKSILVLKETRLKL